MPKVLVVEDEGLIAHDISNRLQALGHEVVATVGTAEEAVKMTETPKDKVTLLRIWSNGGSHYVVVDESKVG